jgi:hypothetical protein
MIYLNKKYLAFFAGLFSMTQVRFVGTFAISEFLMFVTIVYLILKNPRPFQVMFQNRRMIALLILCFLWMCSAFFSDRINDTDVTDSLKGIGGIVPLFFCFIFFFWLFYDHLSFMHFYLWGAAISFIISLFIFVPSALQDMVEDSSGLMENESLFSRLIAGGFGVCVSAYSFSHFSQHPFTVISLRLVVSFYALLQGSRGPFLLGLIGCLVLFYFVKYARRESLPYQICYKIKKMLPLFMVFVVAGGLIAKSIYEFAAKNGYMGEANKQKYEMQSASKIGLLSGRSEFISASLAIADAPWFGHGSYVLDEEGYAVEAAEITGDAMIDFVIDKKGEMQIPAHSHLTGAWVWHGILGAVFWMYALYLIFLFLYRYIYTYPRFMGYLFSACFGMIWTILFSPYSGRPMLGAFFTFIIIMMDQIDQKNKLNDKRIYKN